VAWRKEKKDSVKPAVVRYTRLEGTRDEKLKKLASVRSSADLDWKKAPQEWQASFKPAAASRYFAWPLITDIFPWQQSGVEIKRSWPIGPESDVLQERWKALVNGVEKALLFKETRDRKINRPYPSLFPNERELPPLKHAAEKDMRRPIPYDFRSFDRQYIIPDNRVGDYFRPSLWHAHSEAQLYLSSLFNHPLGTGPALTACGYVPDRHHFRGSYGGKDIIPLYRDSRAKEPNVAPTLLDRLSREFGKSVTAEELAGYIYAVLAQPEYTARFSRELTNRKIRVPLTRKSGLFSGPPNSAKRLSGFIPSGNG
jgi:hypothetical protein